MCFGRAPNLVEFAQFMWLFPSSKVFGFSCFQNVLDCRLKWKKNGNGMGFWFLQTIFSRSIIFLCATVHNFFDWLWFLQFFFWGFPFFPRLVNKVIKTVFLEFHQPFWCLFLGMGHCPTFFATVCRLSCTTCTLGNYFVSWFSLEPRRKQHSTNPLYVDRAPLGVSLWIFFSIFRPSLVEFGGEPRKVSFRRWI